MVNAIAAADRRISRFAKESPEESCFKSWTPGESQTRFDVVLIIPEDVVETALGFARGVNVFIAQAKIKSQILADFPVVLAVKVCFVNSVLQKEGAEALLVILHAAIQEMIEAGNIVNTVAGSGGRAVVKPARKVISQIIELLP
jgi:hypothetical protein